MLLFTEIANCESDIAFLAARYDPATRQWLLKDFDKWFKDPGDSRAYVLLGDPGVGKSVMAGVLAQRSRKAGHLGAAYFCRHNDSTRNDPRYLLGTIAYQLCKCNSQYSSIVGGEGDIRNLLGNCNLGIQELFTKLLQEPLNRCTPYQHRMLVVIDALDETEYKSRDDFLDLIMNRFPLLPEWLVFFITSRPEETVQFRLNKYNPCIKICAGSSAHFNVYQQHERDIKLFLEKRVDFSRRSYSVEDITKMCNGLFLYAFYISTILNDPVHSGKIDQLSDLFPGDIDSFFFQNFKRVFDKVGADLYWKLFGCAIVAPSPLPVSFISFILQRENPDLDEQEVIDAVSQFVVLRTSDETFTFLHNLIPAWLTDKKKASRKFFVDRIKAGKYFRDIIVEFLSDVVVNQRWDKPPAIETDLFDYFLRVGVRFLMEYPEKDPINTVFNCLTSYQYIWKRVQNKGNDIYSLIVDLKLSTGSQGLSDAEREILQKICLALESNVHVLQGSPHLLHSCLRNSSKAVQENVVIPPDVVTSTWMEWEDDPHPACEIPCDMSCFAVSPDKKLLAGGKGKSISLFDAYSLAKVFGPVEVIEKDEDINHVEFSPDGKFVLFGRLDKWFSVEKRCVADFPQFSENCITYIWASFILGGRCLVLERDCLGERKHSYSCSLNIFFRWATQELHAMERMESIESAIWRDVGLREHLEYKVLVDFSQFLERKGLIDAKVCCELKHLYSCGFSVSLCQECRAYLFEKNHRKAPLSIVRTRVIDLYLEIFDHQVWDVQSGRPVLEQAFSSDNVWSPCIFLCHVATAFKSETVLLSQIEKGLSLFNFAFINLLSLPMFPWARLSDNFHESSLRDSFVLKNLPIELHNRLDTESRLSLDGKWIAVRYSYQTTVSLFKKENLENFDFGKPVHIIMNVEQFAFSDDSCVFLYVTKHRSLHAVSLQAGSILSSASRFIPLHCTSEKQAGYFFHAKGEKKIFFVREFPRSYLSFFSIPSHHIPVTVTFTSADTISTLYSDCTVASWKTSGVAGSFAFCGLFREGTSSFASIHAKKAVFSPDRDLIATHRGTEIVLLEHPTVFYPSFVGDCDYPTVLYSSFVGDSENITSYLTFSPDSSLFLYCILSSNDQPLFYVWDVQKKVMSATFDSPLGPQPVHCCCFSADSTKLILCCAFQISIWEYYERPCRLLANVEPFGPFNEFDKFSHCTVSSDNELLACCIVDRIVLYPLNAAAREQTILQLPRAHLGRIEFCQFLKGSRYLISSGVDGTVFLWDLCEWKAIAYARVAQGRESIASLAVSPKEDEVVCFTSFGRLTRIKLCGLVHEMPTKFPTSDWMNREKITAANLQQLGEQQQRSSSFESAASLVDDVEAMDWTALVEDMNFMADENMESDDDVYESDSDK